MRKKLILVFIVMCTLCNNAKAQLDQSAHEIKDSLNLVLLSQIKTPTKTLLDSALQKEVQISVADYYGYYERYNLEKKKDGTHPALIGLYWDYVPIYDREEKIYVKILINGRPLLGDFLGNKILPRVKEVNRVYVTTGETKNKQGDKHIKINFIVNQSYIGTKDEIKFSNHGALLKPRNFLK